MVTGGGEEAEGEDFKGIRDPESVGSSNEIYETRRHRRPTGEDEFEAKLGGGEEGEGGSRSEEVERSRETMSSGDDGGEQIPPEGSLPE